MEITVAYYIGFIIIVAIVLYLVLAYYRTPDKLMERPFDIKDGALDSTQIVLDSNASRQFILSSAGSTILVYVYIKSSDKTPRMDQMPNTLLEIPGVLQFNYGANSSQLTVQTFNTSNRETNEEIIELPPLPAQKWIQLGILRDGRRFDILYNDDIIASKRLAHLPVYTAASLNIGGDQLRGVFRQGRVFNYRLSLQQVRDELADTSDTRQKPPTDITATISNPFSIFSCPGGFFCGANKTRPKNALQEWQTPYA